MFYVGPVDQYLIVWFSIASHTREMALVADIECYVTIVVLSLTPHQALSNGRTAGPRPRLGCGGGTCDLPYALAVCV